MRGEPLRATRDAGDARDAGDTRDVGNARDGQRRVAAVADHYDGAARRQHTPQ